MEISEVRVKLITSASDRLKAVCTVTFDEQFVVRDVKVVEGTNGLFVAMPSRKLSTHCNKCNHKNTIRSQFCNDCGAKLPPAEPSEEENGRSRFHRDIAHPITTPFRELLQARVLEAYAQENGTPGESEPTSTPTPTSIPTSTSTSASGDDAGGNEEGEGGMTEYDAIIAGLKPGGGRGPSRRPSGPSPSRETDGARAQGDGRGRGQGGGRSNERGGRPEGPARRRDEEKPQRSQPRRESSESKPPRAEPVARARTEDVAKPKERTRKVERTEPAHDPVDGFGAGIMDSEPVQVKPAASPKPPVSAPKPEAPAPIAVETDGENAFGAGLL